MNAHLEEIVGHLGAALAQRAPSDDQIIMEHIEAAYSEAKTAMTVERGGRHYHVAGKTVGKPIDECAICGHDLRHDVHARLAEADAVLFDAFGAGCGAVDATEDELTKWAEEGKERYLARQNGTPVANWQPIESAPKDGSSFLACVGRWMTTCHWHRVQQCWTNNGPTYERLPADEQPTHWMPLPKAPKEAV